MNKELAFSNLSRAVDVLDKLKITYWLEAGTCLGAWREHDFIDHDQDIDLGILAEDCADDVAFNNFSSEMRAMGFDIIHIFGTIDCGFEVAFMRDGVKLDVFWFYKKENKRWHGAWKNGGRNGLPDLIKLVFSADLFENLGVVRFRKKNFNVPNPTEKYLIERYGEEWMIPDTNWNWAKDPKCIDDKFDI